MVYYEGKKKRIGGKMADGVYSSPSFLGREGDRIVR
ncbi:hypothetical protein EVA_15250 [gut metagenome]|uniref:Uncharacterized protein n=1 Tax=gut metagenome TaxID=749906 RepID=J9C9U4_9ZZZZ